MGPSSLLILFLALLGPCLGQRSYLRADGDSDNTYNLLNEFLGGTAYEVPDCAHSQAHITQFMSPELGVPVFEFHSHVDLDNDRCENYDRQRTEIKTYEPSPSQFKCFSGESVSYSWDLRLNSAFQPSTAFTHLYQVKAVDGDDSMPFITISPRLQSGNKVLQVLHAGQDSSQGAIWEGDFEQFAGKWIHIVVEYTCKTTGGRFHIRIKNKATEEELMSYTDENIEMWRSGNSFLRPKWGIYRSLSDKENLRDENAYLNNFCLAKGEPLCT